MSDLGGKVWDLDSVEAATLISEVLDASNGPVDKWEIEMAIRAMVETRIAQWPDMNHLQWREAYEFLVASGAASRSDGHHVDLFTATAKPRPPVGSFLGKRGLLGCASSNTKPVDLADTRDLARRLDAFNIPGPVDLADERDLAKRLDVFDMPGTADMMRRMADEIEATREGIGEAIGMLESFVDDESGEGPDRVAIRAIRARFPA